MTSLFRITAATPDDIPAMQSLASAACMRQISSELIKKADFAEKAICLVARVADTNLILGYITAVPLSEVYNLRSLVLREPSDLDTTTELMDHMIQTLTNLNPKPTILRYEVGESGYEMCKKVGFVERSYDAPRGNGRRIMEVKL